MAKKNKPDYYKILGITVKARDKDIKNAALKMLHKYRPDIYKKGDSDLRSEEVLKARDVLLDPDKRAKYDRYWLENYNTHKASTADEEVLKRKIRNNKQVVNDDLSVSTAAGTEAVSQNKFYKFMHKVQLPEREVNKKYPFLFHVYNWKVDGLIFIVTALIIPLIAVFILGLVGNMGHDNPRIEMNGVDAAPMVFFAINIISNIVGFVIFWQRDSKVFTKSGFIIFYSYIFIVNFMSILASIILGLAIKPSPGEQLGNMMSFQIAALWFQIVAEVIAVWLALIKTKDLKKRIIMTLKQNWLMLLIVMVVAGVLLFVFVTWVMPGIFHDVPAVVHSSSNESQLESGLKNGSRGEQAGYAISLFVLTILIAPITEELATRHAVYAGVSNKTVAFFVAALYFAMLHVEGGDVEHIFTYFIGGLFLSGVFSISRGNVTYDTGTHMVYNLISFIIICAQDMHH